MKILEPTKDIADFLVRGLKKGKIFVIPTDTSYGIAGKIDQKTVSKIFKIKKRPQEKAMPIFVNKKIVESLAVIDRRAKILSSKFWPGALTLALKAKLNKIGFLKPVLGPKNTIAVREPNNKLILEVLKKYKKPITATSANISSKPPAYTEKEVLNYFSKPAVKEENLAVKGENLDSQSPDYFVNIGNLPRRPVSTIIDLANNLKILRRGKIKLKEIQKALSS